MARKHKHTEAEMERFLARIAERTTLEDRPVPEIIAIDYKGDRDAYLEDMCRYDKEMEKYLHHASHRPI